jgi:hypothetical protein
MIIHSFLHQILRRGEPFELWLLVVAAEVGITTLAAAAAAESFTMRRYQFR